MKTAKRLFFAAVFALACTMPAKAWECSKGEHQVQVGKGTSGATLVDGLYFQCQPNSSGTGNTNSNTNNNSAKSTSIAKGGAGGTATAQGGYSGVDNSGNSSSTSSANGGTSSATALGGQGGAGGYSGVDNSGNSSSSQTQSTSSSATNNGNGSNNSSYSYNAPRNVATALAPTQFPTATCFKNGSVAGQGPMFGFSAGGGRIDQNCAGLEVAKAYAANGSRLAYCKTMVTLKSSKIAKISLDDCLMGEQTTTEEPPPPVAVAPIVIPPASITVNVPAPIIQAAPTAVKESLTPEQQAVTAKAVKHHAKPCVTPKEDKQ